MELMLVGEASFPGGDVPCPPAEWGETAPTGVFTTAAGVRRRVSVRRHQACGRVGA